MRPNFSAALITDLRSRVIEHNESSSDKVTLNQLKKLYERAFKGERPAERALRKVDEHLAALSKAFDPSKHPRRKDGKFGPEDEESPSAADHFRRAAGAAADAAATAGAKVKRAAHHAAYQAGFADEPLKEGVKAPDVVPLDLPADRHVHRALQAENAGYNALTSNVVPERRGLVWGSAGNVAISATGGVVIAHMLTSKNPNNAVRRGMVRGFAYPVGMAAKIAAGVPLHSLAAGMKLAEQTLGLKLGATRVKDFAHDASDFANAKGKVIGRAVANGVITPMRWGAARLLDVAEGRTRHPPRISDVLKPGEAINRHNAFKVAKVGMKIGLIEGRAMAGRGAGALFLAAVPAYAIQRAIAGTPFDPIALGNAYDNVSYRSMQKVLAMPELDELQKVMTAELRKASPLSELASEFEGKAWSRAGAVGSSALASAVGSALGAGTGAGVQAVRNALNKPAGDPYHDAHGRFTSKENAANGSGIGRAALIGAGVGGALAGGAAYGRLGSLNRGLFHAAMNHLDSHVAGLTDAAKASAQVSSIPAIKDAYDAMRVAVQKTEDGRAEFIKNRIANDKTLNSAIEEDRQFGNSGSLYYKERARQDINSKLVSTLSTNDKFKVPAPKTGELETMTQIRGKVTDPAAYVRKAIDGMNLEQFGKAIQNLSPAQKETAIFWFKKREDSPEAIDAILENHKAEIVKAANDLEAKHAALTDARIKEVDSKAVLDRHPEGAQGPEYDAAAKAHEIAQKTTAKAEKGVSSAQKKLDDLKNNGPEVISAYDGKPIQPPLPAERRIVLTTLENVARNRAADAHDALINKTMRDGEKNIQAARNAFLADLQVDHARKIGSYVALSRKSAGLSQITGRNANNLFAAHVAHKDALAAAETAETKLATAKGSLDKLVKEHKDLPGRGADSQAAKLALADQIIRAKVAVTGAEGASSEAQAAATKARLALMKEANKFSSHYAKFRAKADAERGGHGYMPPEVVRDLTRDVKRAAKAGYDPVSRYAVQPSIANLKKVLAYVGPRARGIGAGLGATADRTFKSMLMHQIPITDADGNEKKVWAPDPFKVTMLGGSGALLALGEFLHKTSDYGKALLAGDPKAKAPTNIQVEMRRHPTKEREGIFAIHAADPRNKGERIVLAGLRYDEGKEHPTVLNPGARLSAVLDQQANRQDNNRPNNQARPADWLSEGTRGAIRNYFKEAQAKPGNANHKITLSSAGTTLEARNHIATEGKAPADNFKNEFRKKFLQQPVHGDAGKFYGALDGLFNTEQSRVLTVRDMYHLLTAFGNKGQQQILNPDENYSKSGDDVSEALSSEISRIMEKAPPRNDAQRDLLRKAVAVVGREKQLSAEDINAISDKIGAPPRQTDFSEAAKEPQIPVGHRTEAVSTAPVHELPTHDISFTLGDDAPRNLSEDTIDQADAVARSVGPSLGIRTDAQRYLLGNAIAVYAGAVSRDGGFDIPTSLKIVKDAMTRMGGGSRADQAAFQEALKEGDHVPFEKAIAHAVRRHKQEQRAQKAAFLMHGSDLDDLDVLMKRMPGVPAAPSTTDTSPRPSVMHTPAMPAMHTPAMPAMHVPPVATDIKLGADVARNFEPEDARGVFRATQRAASRIYSTAQAPKYKPYVDGAAAVADFAGGTLANKALDRVIKTPTIGKDFSIMNPGAGIKGVGSDIKGIFSGGALNTTKNIAALGVKGLVAGGIGSMLYNAVEGAGKGDSYRRNTTPAQSFAMGIGNFAGATAGESAGAALTEAAGKALGERAVGGEIGGDLGAAAGTFLGGPVGTAAGEVAGGAIGAALGEFLTHATLKHFSGYQPAAVQRVLATKVSAPAQGQEQASQTGEIAGGIIGNALGGTAGDGLGGAIGSALGIKTAQAASPAPVLPGRPNTSQGSIP